MDFLTDMYGFLKERRKFWLIPVVIALLLIGVLLMAGGSAMAPFLYTIF